ncbi:hypothetical protein LR48_Vigan10g109300 [Vigna angularis]|uniref:Uncharacterized protein n=1 Tax=Phaseolus angularis TaxID=3914 RepID=A0A0L9VJH7_PHAAN|nr:hypothetical protein LR48_Vigan10g109300 [Vigna angularis]
MDFSLYAKHEPELEKRKRRLTPPLLQGKTKREEKKKMKMGASSFLTYCLDPWANRSIKSLRHRLRGNRSNRVYQNGFWNVRTALVLSSNRGSILVQHRFLMNRGCVLVVRHNELEHSVQRMFGSGRRYCLGSKQQPTEVVYPFDIDSQ